MEEHILLHIVPAIKNLCVRQTFQSIWQTFLAKHMEQNIVPVPLPHEQREQVASSLTLAFQYQIAQHGFTLVRMRKAYTDPDVFQQPWLVCPNGRQYSGHTFYRLFGTTSFRKLFRYVLSHSPCTRETLMHICPDDALLTSYLAFLLDQGWFHVNGHWFDRGPYQGHISNIGKALEWYVAEWFRVTYSVSRLVLVRHGVELAELLIPGDLDIVAFLDNDQIVMVECKSSSEVDEGQVVRFLQRVQAFRPTLVVLLIDTSRPFSQERIMTCNAALATLGYTPLMGSRGLYRGAMNIYIVNVEHSIEISLRDVLNFHQARIGFQQ